jgi:hypothetical protein
VEQSFENQKSFLKQKESKMKTTNVFKLMFIALIVLLNLSDSHSQAKFTAGSNAIVKSSFDFHGIAEGVIEDLATINFTIIKEGSARLSVFDAKGNLINELVEGEMTPGDYSIHYKAGENMIAGEYFLRFEMNGESRTERFLKAQNK